MALTDARIRGAKPRGKAYKLSDAEGLYLLVQPHGAKLWRMNYRFLGKYRTLAIGPYPEIGLQAAREKKVAARRLLAQGIDPSGHKQAQAKLVKLAATNTFAAVADEYLAKVAKQGLAPATMTKKRRLLQGIVCPLIGPRPIAELKPSDILDVLADIESSERLQTAKRVRQEIGAVFRLAALTDRAAGDRRPC